jgi:hypothetical protein
LRSPAARAERQAGTTATAPEKAHRIGRRPVYIFGALYGIALAFPFFWLVGTRQWI